MQDTKEILKSIIPIYDYQYNQSKVGKILYSIITNLNYNRALLEEAARADEKEFKSKIEMEKIYNLAQEFYKTTLPIDQEKAEKKELDGFGNIGVIYNGEPEVTFRLAVSAIRTHNNMVFFVEENNKVNHLLIKIIQDSIKECEYINCIYEIEGFREEFVTYQNYFDLGIFIGDKQEYKRISKRVEISFIYNGFGSASVYADDVYFKDVLAKIDEYVYYHNIHLQYFHEKDIKKDIKKINEIEMNDCVAIFTKDFKKAYDFISKIKSRKVYVNTNPFLEYQFEFDEKDLILEKQIIIKE